MKRIIIIAVVLAGILYLADFLSVRFRIPARDTFGTVTMHTYYVVKLKNGKDRVRLRGRPRRKLLEFLASAVRCEALLVCQPAHR